MFEISSVLPSSLLLGRGAVNEYAISRTIGSYLSGNLLRVIRDNGTMNTPFLQDVCPPAST